MEWKAKGNQRFTEGKYSEAVECYSKALDIDKDNAVLYSNRSAANYQLKDFDKALSDAEMCVKLRPDWEKGYFRKGCALEEFDARQALAAYEEGLGCNASNAELVGKVEAMQQLLQAQSKATAKGGKEASKQDTDGSKVPGPKTIQCIRALCDGEGFPMFKLEDLPDTHPVFTHGVLAPITKLVGLPLRIFRLDPRPSLSIPRFAAYSNQRVTYLMIEPISGLAPPAWQQGIGSVIIARDNRKPLPKQHVEALWMFADRLMDKYGDGPGAVRPDRDITRAAFENFWENYDFSEQYRPEWVNPRVVSPHAM